MKMAVASVDSWEFWWVGRWALRKAMKLVAQMVDLKASM